MRKLKLEIDELRVESFDAGGGDGRGTVAGHNPTADSCEPCEVLPEDSINYCATMGATCAATQCGSCYTCSCGCWNTRVGWTCDPYAAECLPVPEDNPI